MQIKENNLLPSVFAISLGGGSPNLLSISQLKKILDVFKQYTINANIEVHPECVGKYDYFKRLEQIGVTSISVGLQNKNDFVLKASNRGHDVQMFHQVIEYIKATDLLLNIDIMYGGLYGETIENAHDTFIYVFEKLRPDLINAYRACFNKGVIENLRYKKHPDKYPDTLSILEITALLHLIAAKNSYSYLGNAYFVKNYKYNFYKRDKRLAILAVGPGTYSYVFDEYKSEGFISFTPYNILNYYQSLNNKRQPIERMKFLDKEYMKKWSLINDLKYGERIREKISNHTISFLRSLHEMSLMDYSEEGFSISDSGRCIEDLLYASLMPRNMWVEFSKRKKQANYNLNEAKYDWFFEPDVVIGFQDYIQNAF